MFVIYVRFNKQSEFGGYLDILCDFTVYSCIPIGLVLARKSDPLWLSLSVLLSAYFVNAASLFHLSAILVRNSIAITITITIRRDMGLKRSSLVW